MLELPLLSVFAILSIVRLRRVIRHTRTTDLSFTDALLIEEPLLKPAIVELRAYHDLLLALRKRRLVPEGAAAFGYAKGSYSIPIALIIASMIEMAALHFIIPWQWLRVVLILVNIWGILFVLGLIAGRTVHPHVITDGEFHVNWGRSPILRTPVANIKSATSSVNFLHHQPHMDGGRLFLCSFQSPNVLIEFNEPVSADPPVARKENPKEFRASSIHLFADDPDRLVAAVKDHRTILSDSRRLNGAS